MVPGNHEYISGIEESEKFIAQTPIVLLRYSVAILPNQIQLIGRDDRHNKGRKTLGQLTANLDKSKPVILLDHQPYDLEKTEEAGVDLQFSGHTHRGQVWPMNWIVDHLFELSYGIKKIGNSTICGDRLSVSGRTARWWCSILHSKSKDESIYSIDRSAAITKSVYFLERISSASS